MPLCSTQQRQRPSWCMLGTAFRAAVTTQRGLETCCLYSWTGIASSANMPAAAAPYVTTRFVMHWYFCRKEVRVLSPNGAALKPRGYHAMAAVGRCVYVFGGRRDSASDPVSVRSSPSVAAAAAPR